MFISWLFSDSAFCLSNRLEESLWTLTHLISAPVMFTVERVWGESSERRNRTCWCSVCGRNQTPVHSVPVHQSVTLPSTLTDTVSASVMMIFPLNHHDSELCSQMWCPEVKISLCAACWPTNQGCTQNGHFDLSAIFVTEGEKLWKIKRLKVLFFVFPIEIQQHSLNLVIFNVSFNKTYLLFLTLDLQCIK